MRLFIAAVLPSQTLDIIEKDRETLRSTLKNAPLRWTRRSHWHLTLKFLGNAEEELLPELREILNLLSQTHESPAVRFQSYGVFGSVRSPRVLWAGVSDPLGHLKALATSLEEALEPLGFQREDRPFRPHVTLARSKGRLPKKSASLLREFLAEEPPSEDFRISRMALVQSVLKPQGSEYLFLHEVRLPSSLREI